MEKEISIIDELLTFKDKYGSFDAIAEKLHMYPGFAGIHQTTIIRWVEAARKGRIRRRAVAALQILRSLGKSSYELIVALPQSVWALPTDILSWSEDFPLAKQLQNSGVKLVIKKVWGDGEAVEMFDQGLIHLAVMSRELANRLPKQCSVLATIALGEIMGFSTRKIYSVSDLKGLRFAYPAYSIFGSRLLETVRQIGITIPAPVAYTLREIGNIVEALSAHRIDGVIGWPPSISWIRREVQNSGVDPIYLLPRNLLGYIEMVLAVDTILANPTAVREYLRALLGTTRFLEHSKRFNLDKIASTTKIGRKEMQRVHFTFRLETKPFLELWERDVSMG